MKTMMLPVLSVTVLCALTVTAAPRQRGEARQNVPGPSFCFGRHCPEFETIANEADYEVRKYASAKWVTTEYRESDNPSEGRRSSSSQAFMRLFRYISGDNSEGVRIPMTVPVLTMTRPDGVFVRSFYLPADQQDNPPEPTEEGVYIEERPEMTVFVKTYRGWKNPGAQEEALEALEAAVGDRAVPGVHYKAGYGPYRSSDAYNEMWKVANE